MTLALWLVALLGHDHLVVRDQAERALQLYVDLAGDSCLEAAFEEKDAEIRKRARRIRARYRCCEPYASLPCPRLDMVWGFDEPLEHRRCLEAARSAYSSDLEESWSLQNERNLRHASLAYARKLYELKRPPWYVRGLLSLASLRGLFFGRTERRYYQ